MKCQENLNKWLNVQKLFCRETNVVLQPRLTRVHLVLHKTNNLRSLRWTRNRRDLRNETVGKTELSIIYEQVCGSPILYRRFSH